MRARNLLAVVLVSALTTQACDGGADTNVAPSVIGTISGMVTIEGQPASGVSVQLSSGQTATTDASGAYSFSGVPAGAYTVSISGVPSDATFSSLAQAATIHTNGQVVAVNFDGSYIRTSAVTGRVSVEGSGLQGVTVVALGPEGPETTTTGAEGTYAFAGLRGGMYTVSISGFPFNVSFDQISGSATVGTGETVTQDFEGAYLRDAGIQTQVTVGDEGREGVTVEVSGPENRTGTTNETGQVDFLGLIRGIYGVGITNPDPDGLSFDETMQAVDVSEGGTQSVAFPGTVVIQFPNILIGPTSLTATHTRGQSPCPQEIGTLTLTNAGPETTHFSLEMGTLAVSTDTPTGTLEPGASIQVKLFFTCDPNGVDGLITIRASTATAEGAYTVPVTVTVVQPAGKPGSPFPAPGS